MAHRSGSFETRDRLRKRAEFTRVHTGGRRVSGRFVTLLILANDCTAPRLGLIASRKLGPAGVPPSSEAMKSAMVCTKECS